MEKFDMAVTVGEVQSVLTEAQGIGDTVLTSLETLDPAAAAPEVIAKEVLDLLGKYGGLALQAIAGAQGTAITVDSVKALEPDTTPLPKPQA